MLVLLCVWYAREYVLRADPAPYLTGLSSQPVTTQGLIAPIVAALAAWEAARLRRGGVWSFPMARRRLAVVAWPLGLIWAVGFTAVAAGVWTVLATKGFLLPDPRPLAVAAVVIAAHALAGFAFGLSLPIVVAAPVAMGLSLLWQVMPRAIQPLWTHLLTSQQLETCCGPATDLAPAALAAPVLVAIGIAGAAAILIFWRRPAAAAALALCVLLVGLTAGSVVASTQPRGDASVGRDERWLVCAGSRPEVCVWPERESRLAEVADIARYAATEWSRAGLDVPARFDEALYSPPRDDVLRFLFYLGASRDQIIGSLAYGMLPDFPDCPGGYPDSGAFDTLYAWYAAAAGMSADGLDSAFGGLSSFSDDVAVLDRVKQIRKLPLADQRDWVLRNDRVVRNELALGTFDPTCAAGTAGP